MARVFVSYSSADRTFAKRLGADLRGRGAQVWLDEWQLRAGDDLHRTIELGIATHNYFLLVISRASMSSQWVQQEMEWALARESSDQGVFLLPIRIDDAPLPAPIATRRSEEFGGGYAQALGSLLDTLRRATVKDVLLLPMRRFVSARRGIPTRTHSRHHIGLFTMGGARCSVMAVTEAAGDIELGPELAGTITGAWQVMLQKQLQGGRDFVRKDVEEYFKLACAVAVHFKVDRNLSLAHPLGVKMALVLQAANRLFAGTVGRLSIFSRTGRPDGSLDVIRFSSRYKFELPTDGAEVGLSAPIGFLDPDKLTDLEVREFPFATNGDLIALTSFDASQSDLATLGRGIVTSKTPEGVARLLAESREPFLEDTMSAVLVLDPLQTAVRIPTA